MIPKKIVKHISYFLFLSIGKASRPISLKTNALNTIIDNIQDKSVVNFSKRLYPNIFDNNFSFGDSGFNYIFFDNLIPNKEIDLSNMNFERIPLALAKKMENVEKLNLSGNLNLKFNEKWFRTISTKLKEIVLENCNLQESDFDAISNIHTLEKLNISKSTSLNLTAPGFISILSRLKSLDISYCNLNINSFNYILRHATKLEALNFNGNDLSDDNNNLYIPENLIKNLKVLNLSNCNLEAKDLKNILVFTNLESIDLSHNDFSADKNSVSSAQNEDSIEQVKKYNLRKRKYLNTPVSFTKVKINKANTFDLPSTASDESFSEKFLSEIHEDHLKSLRKINFTNCKITSKDFVSKLFDLANLEVLELSENRLNFDFCKIVNGKAKDSLKVLKLIDCGISNPETLYHLTNFSSLEKLCISRNNFENITDKFTLGCSKNSLKKINIMWCRLGIAGLKAITDCKNLEKLNASFNWLENIFDDFELGCARYSLKKIKINSSQVNHNGIKAITNCPKLEYLDASNSNFEALPFDFELGSSRNSLKTIKICQCSLSYHGLKAFTDCPKLETLSAFFNNFENIPEGFELGSSKNSLKEIDLFKSSLNLNGLKACTNCPKLENLFVSFNLFKHIPKDFKLGSSKNSLKSVRVNGCHLNHQGLKIFTDCPNLEKLCASYNNFEEMPKEFTFGLSKYYLQELKLCRCELNPYILKNIYSCKKLKCLDISQNGFDHSHIDENFQKSLKIFNL